MMDEQNDRVADFVEAQLRYLRGEGPPPDLGPLTEADGTEVAEVLDLVEALADSEPNSPPLDADPVAIRLGLVATTTPVDSASRVDPIILATDELTFRLGGALQVDRLPAASNDSAASRPTLICRSLAESVLVVAYDDASTQPGAAEARALFQEDPDLSAIAFTTPDARRALVLTYGECFDRLIPERGWTAPDAFEWDPLSIALGRHFERSMPRWDEVAALASVDLLDDLATEARSVIAEVLGRVASSRPQLPHKRAARDFVSGLDVERFATWLDRVRARQLSGDALVSEVVKLCRTGTP